jgi:hypothetical protein
MYSSALFVLFLIFQLYWLLKYSEFSPSAARPVINVGLKFGAGFDSNAESSSAARLVSNDGLKFFGG